MKQINTQLFQFSAILSRLFRPVKRVPQAVLVPCTFLLLVLFSQHAEASCYLEIPSLSITDGCVEADEAPYSPDGYEVEYMWAENIDGYIYFRTDWSTDMSSLSYCPSSEGYYRLCARVVGCGFYDIYESSDVYIDESDSGCVSDEDLICEAYIDGAWEELDYCYVIICEGEPLWLSVNPNVSTVDWTGPNNFSATNANNIDLGTVSMDEEGTYTATLTDEYGCQATTYITVYVDEAPAAAVSKNDESCDEDDGSITFTFSDNYNRSKIEFSIDGGDTWPSSYRVFDSSGSLTIDDLSAGTYELIVRWGNDDCPVNLGSVTIEAADIAFCTDLSPVLPVEMVYFKTQAQDQVVGLEWLTATEENNAYFEVLRSSNGLDWEVLEKIAGQGTTSKETLYQTIDETPLTGLAYYRLKQVDYDGTFAYSDVQTVAMEKTNTFTTTVFPSITNSIVYVETNTALDDKEVVIYNQAGIQLQVGIVEQANQRMGFAVGQLPEGMYFLTVRDNDQVQTQRFFVR